MSAEDQSHHPADCQLPPLLPPLLPYDSVPNGEKAYKWFQRYSEGLVNGSETDQKKQADITQNSKSISKHDENVQLSLNKEPSNTVTTSLEEHTRGWAAPILTPQNEPVVISTLPPAATSKHQALRAFGCITTKEATPSAKNSEEKPRISKQTSVELLPIKTSDITDSQQSEYDVETILTEIKPKPESPIERSFIQVPHTSPTHHANLRIVYEDAKIFTPFRASDQPPFYASYPAGDGRGYSDSGDRDDRKDGGRENSWQGDDYDKYTSGGDGDNGGLGDSAGGSAGGDEGGNKRKSKKTQMACHFCRGRKLKCDGGRPTCYNCARRELVCSYDESVRRRGPGRKNRGLLAQQQAVGGKQNAVASGSTTSLDDASSLYRDAVPLALYSPPAPLPGPPMPQYPYLPHGALGPGMGPPLSSAESTGMQGRDYRGQPSPPVYTRLHGYHPPRSSSYYPPHVPQPHPHEAPRQQQHYRGDYFPVPYSAAFHRGPRDGEPEHGGYASEGDDEGASVGSRSKRRASSPPEDTNPYSRRKFNDDRSTGT
ncbi:hypothetical protein BU17DRAFT_99403 [Hysterangium stoloniferum]|nr:hypothetical protein BU17DRAFT_99403 [Hysterangium stoloniferum]